MIPNFGYVGSQIDATNVDPFEDHVGDVLNYGWLDPKYWVRRQSKRHSHSGSLLKDHFGDEGSLVVGSDLENFRRGGELLKSQRIACKFQKTRLVGRFC